MNYQDLSWMNDARYAIPAPRPASYLSSKRKAFLFLASVFVVVGALMGMGWF
jgi:hypothetical protein